MTKFNKGTLEQIFYERSEEYEITLDDLVDNPYLSGLVEIPLDVDDSKVLTNEEFGLLTESLDSAQKMVDFLSKYDNKYDGRSYVAWDKAPKDVTKLLESNKIGRKGLMSWFQNLLDLTYAVYCDEYYRVDKKINTGFNYSNPSNHMSDDYHKAIQLQNCFPRDLWSDAVGVYTSRKSLEKSKESGYKFIVSPYALDLMHLGCNGFDETCYRIKGEYSKAPLCLATIKDTVSCWLENPDGYIVGRCWAVFNKDCFVTYNRYHDSPFDASLFKAGVETFAAQHGYSYTYKNMCYTLYCSDDLYVNYRYSNKHGNNFNGQWYVREGLYPEYKIELKSHLTFDSGDSDCYRCGRTCYSDETSYVADVDEYWCERCVDSYAVWSDLEETLISNSYCVEVQTRYDGTCYVSECWAEEHCVVPVGHSMYHLIDDLVFCESNNEYYTKEDAEELLVSVEDTYYTKEYYKTNFETTEV